MVVRRQRNDGVRPVAVTDRSAWGWIGAGIRGVWGWLAAGMRLLRLACLDLVAWRGAKMRLAVAIGVLALGVGLGLAIERVNAVAVAEFEAGMSTLSGEADLSVRGPRSGFDDTLLARLVSRPGVAAASPVVEGSRNDLASGVAVSFQGVDALRAVAVQPALVPRAADADDRLANLRTDAIFVGPRLLERLERQVGDRIELLDVAGRMRSLEIVGLLSGVPALAGVAVVDIATAQVLEGMEGRLSRIDLRAQPGVSPAQLRTALAAVLPSGVQADTPDAHASTEAQVSRAYRANLSVLALVALFCGSLLVFSAQALQVARRRSQFAVLRALGLKRRELLAQQVLQSALIGAVGAALGLALAYGLAALALLVLGGDLGAGFFRGVAPEITFDLPSSLSYFGAGVGASIAGAFLPSLEAARTPPARGLRPGGLEQAWQPLGRIWPGLLLLILSGASLAVPPRDGLPVGGYLAIACLLLGTVALTPRFLKLFVFALVHVTRAWRSSAVIKLALAQLRGAPTGPAVSLAAIVAAVSLAVAMMLMVNSFRVSFEAWLLHILPAEAYLGEGGLRLSVAEQQRIAALRSVGRVEFMRIDEVRLNAGRPPVTVLARDIDPVDPGARLPLVARASEDVAVEGAPLFGDSPVAKAWVSESVAEIEQLSPGQLVDIPLGGHPVRFRIDGIWRDYGRQQGAIVIARSAYVAATGDSVVSNAALWLAPGARFADLRAGLRWLGSRAPLRETGEIRRFSLAIFDRTFAVTWALVAVAVTIGLAALAGNLAALVLARRRELSVLRHLGLRLGDVSWMIALQALVIVTAALATGLCAGSLIGLILVEVVNRQSFHWSMEMHAPWGSLLALTGTMCLLAMVTGYLGGRGVARAEVVRAASEDW